MYAKLNYKKKTSETADIMLATAKILAPLNFLRNEANSIFCELNLCVTDEAEISIRQRQRNHLMNL